MKSILPILFLIFHLSAFGQTKEDFIDCLELVFSQSEFQPAFTNDVTSNGSVVITANGSTGYRATTPKITQIRNGLTQDDFYDFDHPIKVVRASELERLGIPTYAVLEIWTSGGEDQINIGMKSNIKYENLAYSWSYNLKLIDEEWEIIGRSLRKEKSVIQRW